MPSEAQMRTIMERTLSDSGPQTYVLGPGGKFDVNGQADALVLDADADTTISAPTDDQIDIEVGGSDVATFTASGLSVEGSIDLANDGTVTQDTGITTGVTLNTHSGQITTVSQTIAAGAEATFTVTNSTVAATDVVIVNMATNSGNGTIVPAVTAVAAGSFDITLTNLHGSSAGNSTLVLNFAVIGGASS